MGFLQCRSFCGLFVPRVVRLYVNAPGASWASPRIDLGGPFGRWGIRLHRGEYEDDNMKIEYYDNEDTVREYV